MVGCGCPCPTLPARCEGRSDACIFRRYYGMSIRSTVLSQFEQVAREQDRKLVQLTDDVTLTDSGLDSLCFAIIVYRLQDALGVDPFSGAEESSLPTTVGGFITPLRRCSEVTSGSLWRATECGRAGFPAASSAVRRGASYWAISRQKSALGGAARCSSRPLGSAGRCRPARVRRWRSSSWTVLRGGWCFARPTFRPRILPAVVRPRRSTRWFPTGRPGSGNAASSDASRPAARELSGAAPERAERFEPSGSC